MAARARSLPGVREPIHHRFVQHVQPPVAHRQQQRDRVALERSHGLVAHGVPQQVEGRRLARRDGRFQQGPRALPHARAATAIAIAATERPGKILGVEVI